MESLLLLYLFVCASDFPEIGSHFRVRCSSRDARDRARSLVKSATFDRGGDC